MDGELLRRRVLYRDVGSYPELIQLLGVLIVSTRRLRDVPFALLPGIVVAPLPSRIERSPVRGQRILDRPAE